MTASTNGAAKPPRHQIRENLLDRYAEAVLAGKPKTARSLLESYFLWDGFGGSDLFWDRRHPAQDEGDGEFWLPPSIPSDRRHGSNWPIWRNQVELDEFRQISRTRAAVNCFAQGILLQKVNTVIGKGYDYKVKAAGKDGKPIPDDDMSEEDRNYVRTVQGVVDGFCRLNHWNAVVNPADKQALGGTRERECYRTVTVDGECFIRLHGQADGTLIVRFLDPAQVREGGHYLPQQGWTYGIQHQMEPYEDVETYETYAVFWPDVSAKGGMGDSGTDYGTWEEIDAAEILHLKGPDTPSNVKRGLGLFLFDVGEAIDRAGKLQRNASIGAAVRAAIVETDQYDQATQAQISSMAQALAVRNQTDPMSGKSTPVERIRPGTIRRVPTGFTVAPAAADNTESFLHGKEGDLQQASAGAGIASFVLGGLESGNYSNFESASYPPVTNAQCEQEYYRLCFARVVWSAIRWAATCGELSDDVAERVILIVEAPAVLHRNELEKAQEDQILIQLGVKDRETACAERGLDWKQVQANNDEYDQKQQEKMPPGAQPGAPGQPKPPAPKPPASDKGVRESKDAAGHEHDASTGQFTSGGGSGGGRGRAKASEKQHLVDKTEANAGAAHRVMNGLLARMQSGEYSPQDVREDVESYHDKAQAANRAVYNNFYHGLEDQARTQFGEESLQSPEWKAVRSAVAGARDDMAGKLEEMTQVVRYWSKSAAEGNRVPSHAREELPDMHQEAVKMGHEGFHDIADAVDVFKAKHKPNSSGG